MWFCAFLPNKVYKQELQADKFRFPERKGWLYRRTGSFFDEWQKWYCTLLNGVMYVFVVRFLCSSAPTEHFTSSSRRFNFVHRHGLSIVDFCCWTIRYFFNPEEKSKTSVEPHRLNASPWVDSSMRCNLKVQLKCECLRFVARDRPNPVNALGLNSCPTVRIISR